MLKTLEQIVQEFVEIQDRKQKETFWEFPGGTKSPDYSGGDCNKHGRWYGICHGCNTEASQHYESQRKEFEYKKAKDLRDLGDQAKNTLLEETRI